MDCPMCHKHSLRNKTENGVRYRYCKGCSWQKAVKEQVTVDDEMAEIAEKIKPTIEVQPPLEQPKVTEWLDETHKKIADAVGIPAEMMKEMVEGTSVKISQEDGKADTTNVTVEFKPDEFEKQQRAAAEECKGKGFAVQEVPEPVDTGSSGEQAAEPSAEPTEPTLEQIMKKVAEKAEEKPEKKGFFRRLFGR